MIVMGEVILVYRVLPTGPDHFDSVKAGLEKLGPKRLEEEPIGFGLKALKMTVIVPDEGGSQEELEQKISAIKGVGDMTLEHFSRSM